jgi:hypothetical protein
MITQLGILSAELSVAPIDTRHANLAAIADHTFSLPPSACFKGVDGGWSSFQ